MTKIINGETMLEQIHRMNKEARLEHEQQRLLALARIRSLRQQQIKNSEKEQYDISK